MARKPKMGKSKLKLVSFPNGKKVSDLSVDERLYFRQLNKLVDDVYEEAFKRYEWTWRELAEEAGLTYQTVCKLGTRETRYPRFQTVFKLCRAVGWKITIDQNKLKKMAS